MSPRSRAQPRRQLVVGGEIDNGRRTRRQVHAPRLRDAARGSARHLTQTAYPTDNMVVAIGDLAFGSMVVDLAPNPVSLNEVGQAALRRALADGRQLVVRAEAVAEPRTLDRMLAILRSL